MKLLFPATLCLVLFLSACKKNDSPGNVSVHDGLVFDAYDYGAAGFYSTFDTSFKGPLTEFQLTPSQIKNVDMVYYYDTYVNAGSPGFIDPVASSQYSYLSDFYFPWLDSSVQVQFYNTGLTASNFNAAKSNYALLDSYFKDSTLVYLAPAVSPYPAGSIIGGYFQLSEDQVFGFIDVKTGKHGLIHISASQEYEWPFPIYDHDTHVDIIREK